MCALRYSQPSEQSTGPERGQRGDGGRLPARSGIGAHEDFPARSGTLRVRGSTAIAPANARGKNGAFRAVPLACFRSSGSRRGRRWRGMSLRTRQ